MNKIFTADKIKSLDIACQLMTKWRNEGERVVFSNGCFDIVHLGHIDYLEKARHLGSKLIIGINSDASVKRLKGTQRPVQNEYARARMLAALAFVDLVVMYEDDTPLKLIETLRPHILVKGDDWAPDKIVGADEVVNDGGEVKTIPLVKGYSTTSIIEKIKNL